MLIGVLVLSISTLSVYLIQGKISAREFNSNEWKNWSDDDRDFSRRWDMMNSLRNNYELKDKTKNEIIELLGEPDDKSTNEFTYNLGFAKKGIDTGALSIVFDSNGRVKSYNVRNG